MALEDDAPQAARIPGLATLVAAAKKYGQAPVEQWDPPFCGDIGLAIHTDGSWSYQGSPIRRQSLVKLFARVLRRDADGQHYLVTPAEKVSVTVDALPFLAVDMDISGAGQNQVLTFRTNVDDIVVCDADHPITSPTLGPDTPFKPNVVVRGRLQAVLSRPLAHDLAANLTDATGLHAAHTKEPVGIWSSGVFFQLADPTPVS